MKPRDVPEVLSWLAKAREDLTMAEYAAGDGPRLFDQACFHAQQMAEKAVKALIVALDLRPPRTHDLVSLLHLVGSVVPLDPALFDCAAELGPHAVAPRYPSFLAPHTRADAERAIRQARQLMAFVESQIA